MAKQHKFLHFGNESLESVTFTLNVTCGHAFCGYILISNELAGLGLCVCAIKGFKLGMRLEF